MLKNYQFPDAQAGRVNSIVLLITFRGHQKFGIGERDVLSSTNVTKVHNVSINLNAQIFGERCYRLYALSFFGTWYFKAKEAEQILSLF